MRLAGGLAAVALGLVAPRGLAAQVCDGFPSLSVARFRVAGTIAAYSYATAAGVSFTTGRTLFGTLAAGTTRDEELSASTLDVSLEAGADVAIDDEQRLFVCPLATLAASLGPNDFALRGVDYRRISGALGLGLAGIAARSSRWTLVPAAGIRAVRLSVRARGFTFTQDRSDTYFIFTVALGLSYRGVLTVRPGVTVPFDLVEPQNFAIPFGRERGEVSPGITIGVSFGQRAPRSP